MTSERQFRTRIRPYLDALPNSWWESIQQKTIIGSPDIIGCLNGVFVALELKTDKGVIAKMQQYKLDRIKKAGGIATIVTPSTWKDVYEGLKALSLHKHKE